MPPKGTFSSGLSQSAAEWSFKLVRAEQSSGVPTSAQQKSDCNPTPAPTSTQPPCSDFPNATPTILSKQSCRPIVFKKAAAPEHEEIEQWLCTQIEAKIPHGPSLWVPLMVENEKKWSLIDTGASSNLLCKKKQEQVGEVGGTLEPYGGVVVDPKGEHLPIIGVTRVRLNVAGLVTTEKFLVMDGLNPDVIVGLRFLLEKGCQLDWQHCCLWLEGGKRRAPMTVAGALLPNDPDPILTLYATSNPTSPTVKYQPNQPQSASPQPVLGATDAVNENPSCIEETPVSVGNPSQDAEDFRGGFLSETGFRKQREIPWADVRDGKIRFRGRAKSVVSARRWASTVQSVSPKGTQQRSSTPRCFRLLETFESSSTADMKAQRTQLEADVETVLQLTAPDADEGLRQHLRPLIKEFRGVFALTDEELGSTNLTTHRIDTGDAPPIKRPPHRMASGKIPEMKTEVQDMLERGIIRSPKSPYSSPIVIVKKKDGADRFCVDYRKLNEITRKDVFPIPRIEQTLDALEGSSFFSTLDLASGYWQVPVATEDIAKTAFVTPDGGLYEYMRMPFGLCNAPATFQRLMNGIYSDALYNFVIVFLDDVLVYSKTEESHFEHLRETLTRLRQA